MNKAMRISGNGTLDRLLCDWRLTRVTNCNGGGSGTENFKLTLKFDINCDTNRVVENRLRDSNTKSRKSQ